MARRQDSPRGAQARGTGGTRAAGAVVSGPAGGCCWCTARSTTTGPSPRASSTGRARGRRGGPGGRRGDRPARPARPAAPRPALPGRAQRTRRCTTGGPGRRRRRRRRPTAPTTRSTEVAWVDARARRRRWLTYDADRDTLRPGRVGCAASAPMPWSCCATARPGPEARWRRDDRLRPLLRRRPGQAQRLVPVLAGLRRRRLVSSSSARCVQTLAPYAEATGWPAGRPTTGSARRTPTARVRRVVEDARRRPAARGIAEASCCAPTGRCCPTVFDALGRRPTRAGAGRAARRPPAPGRGRGARSGTAGRARRHADPCRRRAGSFT